MEWESQMWCGKGDEMGNLSGNVMRRQFFLARAPKVTPVVRSLWYRFTVYATLAGCSDNNEISNGDLSLS
jgi:hypothetical protein